MRLLFFLLPLFVYGCSPTAFPANRSDPTSGIDASLVAAQSALDATDRSYLNAESDLPPRDQARYAQVVDAVRHAMATLRAAKRSAREVGSSGPDLRAAASELLGALDDLVKTVCAIRGLTGDDGQAGCLDEVRQQVALARRLLAAAELIGGGP